MNNSDTLSAILNQSANCFFVVLDSEQKLIKYNNAFENLFAGTSLFNTLFLSVLPEHLHKHWNNVIERLKKNPTQIENFIGSIDPSNIIHWEIMTTLSDDGSVAGFNMIGIYVKGHGITSAPEDLKNLVSELEKIMSSSLDIICTINEDGNFITISEACKYILGYTPRELIGQNYLKMIHSADKGRTLRAAEKIKQGFESKNLENRFYRKDGTIIPLMWSMKWDEIDKRYYGVGRDVTEKKHSEEILKSSEEKYKLLFNNNPVPMWIFDIETFRFLEVNVAAIENYGYSREEFLQMTIKDIRSDAENIRLNEFHSLHGVKTKMHQGYWRHTRKNGTTIQVELIAHLIDYEGRKAKLVLASDRTQQLQAEQDLIRTNERYSFVSKATNNVIWDWDLSTDVVEWNEVVKSMFGYADIDLKNADWWQENLHPDDRERVVIKLEQHVKNHQHHWEDEYLFRCANGEYKYIFDRGFTIYDEFQKPLRMIGAMQDLTDRKANELQLTELNTSLEKRARELAESNAELERFAYVASHDLQEPLRMVSSFLQLIEKKYKDRLDQKGHEYIAFAVDGAERMKLLILDLLEYSRVNTSQEEREEVNTNAIVNDLQLLYKNVLEETKGTIHYSELPIVYGSRTQVMQLFQNLLGNALKYKSDLPPEIKINYTINNQFIEFSISDNGIGIDDRFFNKIFIIFQRLHNREQYKGTGIGLAICKKIVERHGGKIWLTSTPGKGSTFYFTLPKL